MLNPRCKLFSLHALWFIRKFLFPTQDILTLKASFRVNEVEINYPYKVKCIYLLLKYNLYYIGFFNLDIPNKKVFQNTITCRGYYGAN